MKLMELEMELGIATHWWTAENNSVSRSAVNTIPWIFKTGDALYGSVKHLFPQGDPAKAGIAMSGEKNLIINLPIPPAGYFHLRGILAMTADLYRITNALLNTGDTANAESYLKKVRKGANKFRDLRNFFEHIDDRLINLDKHGISGQTNTNCGIDYALGTKDCFHLVYDGVSFHFTDEKRAKERSFTFSDFKPIFEGLEGLYNEITSHKIHSKKYPDFNEFINYKEL